jgi:GrpB-like predicted nucleotidyltransferase (UPF0157 family)
VIIVPPNPGWAQQARAACAELLAVLAGQPAEQPDKLDAELHHIGSTAISGGAGIWAKPIIDLMLVVRELPALDAATPRLVAAGWEAMGEFGIPGRRYFRRHDAQGVRSHHLHAFARGSAHIKRHLAFCDYMNQHPEAAQAYSQLKQGLARQHGDNMAAYIDGKDSFVREHEALALAWAALRPRAGTSPQA